MVGGGATGPAGTPVDRERAWKALETIADPEIPTLSLVEMRVLRSVDVEGGTVHVVISPTFAGCPAMDHIRGEIRERLHAIGAAAVEIETTYSPPWSSDMLEPAAREKLRAFGIAPPPPASGDLVTALELPVACPWCGAEKTRLENPFGPTLCRQIFYCDACRQSFERFKPL